jgi:hypothetical protein
MGNVVALVFEVAKPPNIPLTIVLAFYDLEQKRRGLRRVRSGFVKLVKELFVSRQESREHHLCPLPLTRLLVVSFLRASH